MKDETLPPQVIDRYVVVARFSDWPKEFGDKNAVRAFVQNIPAKVGNPDTPLEQIELAVFYEDGGSEAVKNSEKLRVLQWLERIG